MYRICPGRTLTLNNRWMPYWEVYPKNHVFFIPWDGGYNKGNLSIANKHIESWILFLKETKKRRTLFLHTLNVEYGRRKDRILKVWKGNQLQEIMLNVDYLGHIQKIKVQTV